ncbi:hypothetical protein BMMON2_14070 [Burkholderia mallei]
MHAMVTGELPPAAVVRSIQDTYRPLAARELTAREPYSPAFLAAIDHALQLKIADRPESVAEFAAELGLREFDRPPYVAPMPAGAPQPREARDAGAAEDDARRAAASGSPEARRRGDADVDADARPDGERARQPEQPPPARQSAAHRLGDSAQADGEGAGDESGAAAARWQGDDERADERPDESTDEPAARAERAMAAQSGAQPAQTPRLLRRASAARPRRDRTRIPARRRRGRGPPTVAMANLPGRASIICSRSRSRRRHDRASTRASAIRGRRDRA